MAIDSWITAFIFKEKASVTASVSELFNLLTQEGMFFRAPSQIIYYDKGLDGYWEYELDSEGRLRELIDKYGGSFKIYRSNDLDDYFFLSVKIIASKHLRELSDNIIVNDHDCLSIFVSIDSLFYMESEPREDYYNILSKLYTSIINKMNPNYIYSTNVSFLDIITEYNSMPEWMIQIYKSVIMNQYPPHIFWLNYFRKDYCETIVENLNKLDLPLEKCVKGYTLKFIDRPWRVNEDDLFKLNKKWHENYLH